MRITALTVKNFRNLESQKLTLFSGLNIFFGGNAQGKTNLLESVYLCSLGKSPRTEKDKDLVQWGEKIAHVRAEFSGRFGEGQIAVGIDTTAATKKHVSVNSVPVTKLGDMLGYLNCIYFSPDEIKIVSESPAERRRFLDIDLCQIDKNYFFSLSRFNKALAQRNNLLKSSQSLEKLKQSVFVWDRQIAENGARIILKRKQFCTGLKELASNAHKQLTNGAENLFLNYSTHLKGETTDELIENYLSALETNLKKDFELKFTSVGCQRDDIELSIDGKDIRHFASQGQQRTTALALKLAELEIFCKISGEMPILLLDDVLSELDFERQKQLLSFASKTQILLTTACQIDEKLLPKEYAVFKVEKGKATQSVFSKLK